MARKTRRMARETRGPARTFALVLGTAYLGVALLEVLVGRWTAGGAVLLDHEPVHNTIHWLTAAALLTAAFVRESAARPILLGVGTVFALVSLMGVFARGTTGELLGYGHAIPWVYNWIHIATAAGALYFGWPTHARTGMPSATRTA